MTSTITYNGVEYVQFNPDIEPVDDYTIKLAENGGTVKYFKKKEIFPKRIETEEYSFVVDEYGYICVYEKPEPKHWVAFVSNENHEALRQALALSDKLRGNNHK